MDKLGNLKVTMPMNEGGDALTVEGVADGVYRGIVVDASGSQIVRIELNAETKKYEVWVWADKENEDYTHKIIIK